MKDKLIFTEGNLVSIYAKSAFPIIFVMGMSGLLTVVDAIFLGIYVGSKALASVTLIFPIYMLITALATLVSSGMSSLLARNLGAGNLNTTKEVFAGAHGLALTTSAILILFFAIFGKAIVTNLAGQDLNLIGMGLTYLQITVLFTPLFFVLSVNSDALRNEGHVGIMAAASLFVSIANIAFNFVFIAILNMGVAGSALGTSLAQLVALIIIFAFRRSGSTSLRPTILLHYPLNRHWRQILMLGAPQSLTFTGVALGSLAIITSLQLIGSANYSDTVSAYGIISRVTTFAVLPIIGLSFAMQTITGNNYGAGVYKRSDKSLKIALLAALLYCSTVQFIMMAFSTTIAAMFIDDVKVISEIERIMPVIVTAFILMGPLFMVSAYFQAIGDATKATILSLAKAYVFSIPLTFLLPMYFGESGIWYSAPISEVLLLTTTILVLLFSARRTKLKWGLFQHKNHDKIV
jgi:putative MATE family efflux protein